MSKLYRSYLFKNKDPAIDVLRTVIQDNAGGKITPKVLKGIEVGGGPTVSCMNAWFYGGTKRPQNATIEAAGRAIGYERKWIKAKGDKS